MAERAIYSEADLANFKESKTYADFLDFVRLCGSKVKGCPAEAPVAYMTIPIIGKIVAFFDKLQKLTDEIPPIQQPMRFGNKAFRQWYQRVVDIEVGVFLADILTPEQQQEEGFSVELQAYLFGSFGNEVRIDYGTGHETSFAIFLFCLHRAGLVDEDSLKPLILGAFGGYLTLMRHLQLVYMLEPAGSHGVWGLDDYQCLLFVWGSAQVRVVSCPVMPCCLVSRPYIVANLCVVLL